MARTIVAAEDLVRTGLAATFNAATASVFDSFANDGHCILEITASTGASTLTIQTPGLMDTDLAIAERTISNAGSGSVRYAGPFPTRLYNQADGRVYLDWSNVTGVAFAVIRVPTN
jgi:hypothetical protein